MARSAVVYADEKPVSKILFGSCIRQDQPAPLLQLMAKQTADLTIFLGDNIYGDTEEMSVLQSKYEKLAALPGFAELMNSTTVLATWDDHDFGVNDGGADYPQRVASEKVFLDFWKYPETAVERTRPGIYGVRSFGPVGKRLQVILLDTRYFRSPLKTGPRRVAGPYYPDDDPIKTILGNEQWSWLAEVLREPADVRILASSIQCLPSAAGQECWSNLPHERNKLLELIDETGANNLFIISGDRHWSEISRFERESGESIFEFTSSSINQPHPRGTPSENRFRFGEKTFHQQNYGMIEIDWAQAKPIVRVQVIDQYDQAQLETELKFSSD